MNTWVIEIDFFDYLCILFRPVAQLVEHVTLNHGVEGSIPSGPTKYQSLENRKSRQYFAGFFHKQLIGRLVQVNNFHVPHSVYEAIRATCDYLVHLGTLYRLR
jgi:hypothetical protein